MLKKDNFFKNYFITSNKYYNNLIKTKKVFNSLKSDLDNFEIPLLESYDKSYKFDFSKTTVKKFSRYRNIVVIGMGGSILGTKSIYSFLRKKIKKNFFWEKNNPQLPGGIFYYVNRFGRLLVTIGHSF